MLPPAPINYGESTALVTGGSSGIGQAIAHELVKRGVRRIVIIAHDEGKLSKAVSELEAEAGSASASAGPRGSDSGPGSGLEVKSISVDLSKWDVGAEIQKQVEEGWGWRVDILVNDAGLARKQRFAMNGSNDISLHTVDTMIRATVDLSLRFLPGMVQRGSGGILNVCSTAAYQPVPFTAMYAASKAFMLSWSQAIREENIETGVRIAAVVPGITETNLDGDGHGERRGTLDAVGIHQPGQVATAALDAYEANAAQQVVGFNNALMQGVLHLVPDSVKAGMIHKARGEPEDSDNIGVKGKKNI